MCQFLKVWLERQGNVQSKIPSFSTRSFPERGKQRPRNVKA